MYYLFFLFVPSVSHSSVPLFLPFCGLLEYFLEFHFVIMFFGFFFFSVSLCVGFLVIIMLGDSVAGQPLGVGKKLLGLGLPMPLGKGQGDTGFTAAAVGGSDHPLTSQLWTTGQNCLRLCRCRPQGQRIRLSLGPGLQWGLELLTGPPLDFPFPGLWPERAGDSWV